MLSQLKSTKISKKTFTMKFEFKNGEQLKDLQALSILLGNYNPMRKQMIDEKEVLSKITDMIVEQEFEWNIKQISKLLK